VASGVPRDEPGARPTVAAPDANPNVPSGPSAASDDDPLRAVCPFCGEPGPPGADRCPAHDLPLNAEGTAGTARDEDDEPEDRLPPDLRPMAIHDLRAGRGWLLLSALLLVTGLAFPFADLGVERVVVRSGFEVAAGYVAALWAVPAVGLWMLLVFRRRLTRRSLRGARLAVPLLGLLAGASLAYAVWRLHRVARALAERGIEVDPGLGSAVWVIGAGVAVSVLTAPWLGGHPALRATTRASSSTN